MTSIRLFEEKKNVVMVVKDICSAFESSMKSKMCIEYISVSIQSSIEIDLIDRFTNEKSKMKDKNHEYLFW